MQKKIKFAGLLLAGIFCLGHMQAASKVELNIKKTENLQQKRKITGIVQDAYGTVIGASVSIKGISIGTMTDIDGRFTLNVAEGQTIDPLGVK